MFPEANLQEVNTAKIKLAQYCYQKEVGITALLFAPVVTEYQAHKAFRDLMQFDENQAKRYALTLVERYPSAKQQVFTRMAPQILELLPGECPPPASRRTRPAQLQPSLAMSTKSGVGFRPLGERLFIVPTRERLSPAPDYSPPM